MKKRQKSVSHDENELSLEAEEREQKRYRPGRSKYKHVMKLLSLAAEGKHRKIAKLLQKHASLDVNAYNSEGLTALHQV